MGFSLPELLAVLALLGIALAVGIPLVNEQIRLAEIRGAATNLAVTLRAVRMIAVTRRQSFEFDVLVDQNKCSYHPVNDSSPGATKDVTLPDRVRIAPESDRAITFKQNGSVDAACSIVLEADVPGARDRWTTNVNTMGMASVIHERVSASP